MDCQQGSGSQSEVCPFWENSEAVISGMKVLLNADIGEEKLSLKLTLPKSWRNGEFSKLQETLVEKFNEKHRQDEGAEINTSEFHFERENGTEIPFDGIVKDLLDDNESLFLKPGKAKSVSDLDGSYDAHIPLFSKQKPKPKSLPPTKIELEALKSPKQAPTITSNKSLLQCKNFGCQKKFDPSANHPEACRHHKKPPIFHETRKYWACCSDKIAWDWESFTAIPGCKVSAHSDTREGKSFLGGTDVRKKQEDQYAGPQRLDGKPRELSSLERLSALRRSLVSAGVDGGLFDDARDRVKVEAAERDESLGKKVWDDVFKTLVGKIETSLRE